jgi:ABC-type Fe3+-hydroxamate transport system substrate-binding protein
MRRKYQTWALLLSLLGSVSAMAARKVHDELGREVAVPDSPHRIVCLAPSITDIVFTLGAGARVAGITDYTKYPPEASAKPSVGGVINPSLEKLASLQPDLVLAIADLNSFDIVRSIQDLGFPVFIIQPHGIAGIYRSVQSIGEAINEPDRASALVRSLRAREDAVRRRVAGKKRPSLFFLLWPDPLMSAGKGAFINELIEIAGASSITSDVENEWPRIALETVVARQPQYLLIVKGTAIDLANLRSRSGWNSLEALKNGRVLYVDDRINFPSPLAFDALEDLAKQLHP